MLRFSRFCPTLACTTPETMDTLTAYFQSLFAQQMNDGTLKRAEMDRLRNRAKRSVKAEIRGKREACHPGGGGDRHDCDRRNDDRRRDAHRRLGRKGRIRRNNQPKHRDRDGGGDRGACSSLRNC
jgi:hypothetical protein